MDKLFSMCDFCSHWNHLCTIPEVLFHRLFPNMDLIAFGTAALASKIPEDDAIP
jgi:hypothetical protein